MQVSNSYNFQPAFGVNLNSPKLRYSQKDFFIKIRGYGQNTTWADIIKTTADNAVKSIRKNKPAEIVLKEITAGVTTANQIPLSLMLRLHTGILRTPREGWRSESVWENNILKTNYTNNKYKKYKDRFISTSQNPLKNPFNDLELAKIEQNEIIHPNPYFINNAFKHIEELYEFIQSNFIKKEIKPSELNLLNNKVAEMRWILAHSMPWERGTDSISNVFMRAIYKATGVKAYPPAKGISFDLEAFCTNLEEYKKNFPTFFEKPLEIIE